MADILTYIGVQVTGVLFEEIGVWGSGIAAGVSPWKLPIFGDLKLFQLGLT